MNDKKMYKLQLTKEHLIKMPNVQIIENKRRAWASVLYSIMFYN